MLPNGVLSTSAVLAVMFCAVIFRSAPAWQLQAASWVHCIKQQRILADMIHESVIVSLGVLNVPLKSLVAQEELELGDDAFIQSIKKNIEGERSN